MATATATRNFGTTTANIEATGRRERSLSNGGSSTKTSSSAAIPLHLLPKGGYTAPETTQGGTGSSSSSSMAPNKASTVKEFFTTKGSGNQRSSNLSSTTKKNSSWNPATESSTTTSSATQPAVMQELVLDPRKPIHLQDFQEVDFEEAIIAEREREVKKIHRDMVGLNEVFRDMDMLVHEQGEMVESIETSVSQARRHSEKAVEELKSAEKKQETSTAIGATLATVGTVAGATALIVLL